MPNNDGTSTKILSELIHDFQIKTIDRRIDNHIKDNVPIHIVYSALLPVYYDREIWNHISQKLYSDNFKINRIIDEEWGNTLVQWCIADYGEGSGDLMEAFLLKLLDKLHADPFIPDRQKKHVLHLLIAKGYERQKPLLEVILNHKEIKEHVNDKMDGGFTPLHLACIRRDFTHIKPLLEAGANTTMKDDLGRTPLNMLNLDEVKRLKILTEECFNRKVEDISDGHLFKGSNESNKIKMLKGIIAVNRYGYTEVATIDDKIFNSDPEELKRKIDDFTVNSRLGQINLDNKSQGKSV